MIYFKSSAISFALLSMINFLYADSLTQTAQEIPESKADFQIKLSELESQTDNNTQESNESQTDSKTQTIRLENITTTANKYEAEIAQINSAVQVVGEKQLLNAKINTTSDLANVFPGLLLQNNGMQSFPTATLRGLSSPDYYSTTLNLYIDGIPQSPNFLIQALGDIEQIELLKGPQGTLFGENSQSGIISIRTKNPMRGNYTNISLSASLLEYDVNGYAGGAVIKDKLWIKGNFRYIYKNGFIKDPDSDKMLNGGQNYLAGLALYYAPTQSFLAVLNYNYSGYNDNSNFYLTKTQYENNNTITPGSLEVNNFGSGDVATAIGSPNTIYKKNPFEIGNVHNASLKLEYNLGDSLLTSITAFQKSDTRGNIYPIVSLENEKTDGYYYNTTQAIQELRFDTEYANGARSTFGIYYKYLLTDNGMKGFLNTETTFGFKDTWNVKESVNTIALFGDGSIPLGDSFDVGIGARYQYYHASVDAPIPPVSTLSAYSASKGWHSFNPRISFGYTLNKQVKFYLAATSSTKQGGFVKFPYALQDTDPYKPEQIYSIELGNHMKFLDSKLRANIAIYFMYIQDRQSYVGSGIYQSLKNIGDAYSTGIEMDFGYYGERIQASIGLNIGRAQYFKGGNNKGQIIISGNAPQDYDVGGQILKYSPLVSLVANIDWNFYRLNNHRFYIGANMRFMSNYYYDDLDQRQDLEQEAYVVLDLNLRYEWKNMIFKLYTQNTTNSHYALYARNMGIGETYYIPANPFNIGGQISYRY